MTGLWQTSNSVYYRSFTLLDFLVPYDQNNRQTRPLETPYCSENEETLWQPASRRSYDIWSPTRNKKKISLLTVNIVKFMVNGDSKDPFLGLMSLVNQFKYESGTLNIVGGVHWGLGRWMDGGGREGGGDRWADGWRDGGTEAQRSDGQYWPQQNP